MTKAKSTTANYQTLKDELDMIMSELVHDDLDIDTAMIHYQRGLELVRQLEDYLINAENQITELKAKFNKPAA